MTKLFAALMCLGLTAFPVSALDVEISAGQLADAIAEPETVADLRITGSVNAADLYFVASEMTDLRTLDLAGATVEAYTGDPIMGLRSFPAGELPAMVLAGSPVTSIVLPASLTSLGECSLAGAHITSIALPATLRTIASGALAGCPELATAEIGCAEIGDAAFASCHKLASVTLLAPATRLGARSFADCTSLATINGAESVTYIGDRALQGCSALTEFAFGEDLRHIGSLAFSGSALRSANMGSCIHLAQIGTAAFSRCDALTTLVLPEGCDISDARALALGSKALATVKMPVAEIPAYSLASDAAVAELTLPSSVEYIGDNAMEGMKGLTKINAQQLTAVPELGTDVWHGIDQSKVELKASDELADAFRSAAQWKEFKVTGSTTTGDILGEQTVRVSARFVGMTLEVRCSGDDIDDITVADIEGRILAVLHPDADGTARLDTAPWHTSTYLLTATAPDFRATLKLIRTL